MVSEASPSVDEQQQQLLDEYVSLLCKWNKAYNLTAIRNADEIQTKHIADSLSVNSFLQGDNIIDVGTGAGLPGIPLAILNRDKHFTLLDSSGKKIRFIRQAVQVLNLNNVEAVHSRCEEYRPEKLFDSVISRAFASIYAMLAGTEHLLAARGRFLAMKGLTPESELEQLPKDISLVRIHSVDVPGLDAARCLVELKKATTD
jgi:16S rRNA (guanine527-N7)-methyltransferase